VPTDYHLLAEIYEPLGHIYTGGGIRNAKRAAATGLSPGDHVLCVGGGAGEEARFAEEAGARVVLIDRSPDMLRTARKELEGVRVEMVETDLDAYRPTRRFDVVWSHFFLNVFGRGEAKQKLGRLARLVAPGGKLTVTDFAPGGLARQCYHAIPLVAFCCLTGNAWHSIYDYASWPAFDLQLRRCEDFPIFSRGPRWIRQWTWEASPASTRRSALD